MAVYRFRPFASLATEASVSFSWTNGVSLPLLFHRIQSIDFAIDGADFQPLFCRVVS
jgi:hypothetical protein